MTDFWINSVAAKILIDRYGYKWYYPLSDEIHGNFTVACFDSKRLIRLHSLNRPPAMQLSPDQVLEVQLIPTNEARAELLKLWNSELKRIST